MMGDSGKSTTYEIGSIYQVAFLRVKGIVHVSHKREMSRPFFVYEYTPALRTMLDAYHADAPVGVRAYLRALREVKDIVGLRKDVR